ncbi:YobI family P-loop NTPase [Lacrimispora sp.]|uniref:YobI family P-loop NTPase n=1 Tax=Lacrimispora sp. TaxID=2719234 RepID=UPI0028A5DC01|nr:hypothetical protein [Lacrimispora sp.]
MKFIIKKVKAWLSFKLQKDKTKIEYTDLAPIDEIANGDAYLNALDWALNNDRVKNIALAGPYGAGKSSIIETYLKQHPTIKGNSLRISMAAFMENAIDEDGTSKKVDIGQDEIEFGILKQLFYKVDYKKIPQSRYRKLHKISWKHFWGYLIGLSIIISLMEYIFFPEVFNSIVDKIITAGASVKLSSVASLLLFGALVLGILAVVAVTYRSILSHFKVKEIKFPIDATVKSEEDANENVFNKNMDEIVYFFEETKYRLVFFEDLDRLGDSSIFVHLRELNTLLNNYDVIKEPIVFVYAVKDDIFSDVDRTKFFDFIVPVIPVINATNSGEFFLENLNTSSKMGITHEISQSFVLDVSPYISDMRILQNIYNEFVVYKKTLRTGQGLKLSDELMMALVIFKNLYPRDFADIQMERGVIKQAFIDKQKYLILKQAAIQSEIDETTKVLAGIQSEALENIKELKVALLSEITDWNGVAYQITTNGGSTTYADDVIQKNFNISKWCDLNICSGSYYKWRGGGGHSFSCNRFSEICASYSEREKRIKLIEERRIEEEQEKVEKLRMQLQDISGWSLKRLVEQFGVEEVLLSEVRENKLLVFLLRRGYIDEKYANYINYFKGNSITKGDMNFILAVKNMEPQLFLYSLMKTPMVVQKLQLYEFGQKAIYNFDLLECLLSSDDHREKLNAFVKQLTDEDEQSWKFIDGFIDLTDHQSYFIKLLASNWSNMWGYIASNAVLTYERKIHYFSLLISNADIKAIVAMNVNNEISGFIEQNEDILQQLTLNCVESIKVIAVIDALGVTFSKVYIENVSEDVIDYVFDNNCYELNQLMIQHVVEYKNKALVPDLKSKNYTTIIKLGYAQLIEYVRGNLSQYIEKVVLSEEHVFDAEEQIVDLLERSIDNQMLCINIIVHEEFCMEDITCCCGELITEKASAVKGIWDSLFKNNKILPTWKNVNSYWSVFKFTQEFLNYIESHTEDLVSADCQCISDDFIRGFIGAGVADRVFETLLPHIRMNNFDIVLASVTENIVAIMIGCKYFEFTVAYYDEIKKTFPDLRAEFILQNQVEYIAVIDNIQMDANLLENLLFSNRLEAEKAQILFDTYGTQYMTNRIAGNLQSMGLTINLEIFNKAWECLDEFSKLNLMLEHLELLDAEAIHSCFTELERWYSDFLDRSKQHMVELVNTQQNQKLAERLKAVDYITSYTLKEKRVYDSVTETEMVKTVILCRVKVIK